MNGRTTARREADLAAWSRLHHGIDPAAVPLLRGWLRLVHAAARPLLRVPPTVLTVVGALLALAAVPTAALGSGPARPLLALALVLASVACDALDGAVAALADRATALGAVADRTADRVSDLAFAAVLWRCGAPVWAALAAAALTLGLEGPREFARAGRRARLRSTVTVGERPTRTICVLLACGCAAVSAAAWPAAVCAAVWIAAVAAGAGQLALVARRVPAAR